MGEVVQPVLVYQWIDEQTLLLGSVSPTFADF
jgi:hypothetical protein